MGDSKSSGNPNKSDHPQNQGGEAGGQPPEDAPAAGRTSGEKLGRYGESARSERRLDNDQPVRLRSICWQDLCPWVTLFRVFRVSVSLQVLLLGFLGAWAMTAGWQMTGALILDDSTLRNASVQQVVSATFRWPGTGNRRTVPAASSVDTSPNDDGNRSNGSQATESVESPNDTMGQLSGETSGAQGNGSARSVPMTAPSRVLLNVRLPDGSPLAAIEGLVVPVRAMMFGGLGWRGLLFCTLGTLWNLIVWGVLGGAITRVAAVRLGRDERVGLRESLTFSIAKFASYLGGPLLPLVTIFVLALPLLVLGFLMRLNLGVVLGGLLWLPAGVLGFTMALFAIGLLFGWPLMWAAISTEGSDAFDGISRAFAYTFQRPLHYLCYAVVAVILGLLGAVIVQIACILIVQFTTLPAVLGMGTERFGQLRNSLVAEDPESTLLWLGASLIQFFNSCFFGIQRGYAFSFLWVAATCIYLLLRRDADHTELDSVFVQDVESDPYGLPNLSVDPVSGVPVVSESGADELARREQDKSAGKQNEPDEPTESSESSPDEEK